MDCNPAANLAELPGFRYDYWLQRRNQRRMYSLQAINLPEHML
jgi:hypothetical protein